MKRKFSFTYLFTFNDSFPMNKLKQSVGIDVSKDKLDVCFSSIDSVQKVTIKSTRRFDNQAKGFKELEA